MYIKARTIDDILGRVLRRILRAGKKIYTTPTRGGAAEIRGVLLHLTNPRARLSQSESRGRLFSGLGELLWYLAGANDLAHIAYYISRYSENSDDQRTVYGAYGPRLFGGVPSQMDRAIRTLRRNPASRRVVVAIFQATDTLKHYKDVPCTTTMQFMQRNGRIDMVVSMRSNDAYLGLPHDFFAFTMLQEIVARSVGAEVGHYYHAVGSLHLYHTDRRAAYRYVREGWHPTTTLMPPMPLGRPRRAIRNLLGLERALRTGKGRARVSRDSYWGDLGRLLWIFREAQAGRVARAQELQRGMKHRVFAPYVAAKVASTKKALSQGADR